MSLFKEVVDLSPIQFRKQSATDGRDLNIGETRVWRLDCLRSRRMTISESFKNSTK